MTLRIIGGKWKGRSLKTPKSSSTRPTQSMLREAVFNICQNEIANARFLDLFAGSGAMGLEALSRGASHATFVEQNRAAAACIKENIASLSIAAQSDLLCMDVARAIANLAKRSSQFDIVYADPPYELLFSLPSLAPLLAPHALIFLEERYDPKTPAPKAVPSDNFALQNTRHFGVALLSFFHYKRS